MSDSKFDIAAEFCKVTDKQSLFEYLDVELDADAETMRGLLRKRRKRMQGMQSNPKFRTEARFLIKNFQPIESILDDLDGYRAWLQQNQESANLPIVEMTIRTVLKGGRLDNEQQDYLQRQASELGVSEDTFVGLLSDLAKEAGVALPGMFPSDVTTAALAGSFDDDLYMLLAVPPRASREDIYRAYRERHSDALKLSDPGRRDGAVNALDRAWTILGDPQQRASYDMSRTSTGPPARSRDSLDFHGSTAPPVRKRQVTPDPNATPPRPVRTTTTGPRLEVLGDPTRYLDLSAGPIEIPIMVRNIGDGQMPGRISTDEPWLVARPSQLDPNRREQVITVQALPQSFSGNAGRAVLTIQTENGERAGVVFEAVRAESRMPIIVAAATVLGVVIVLAVFTVVTVFAGTARPKDHSLTITIDPTAEEVMLNGSRVGTGSSVYIAEPTPGKATLEVFQPNFDAYRQEFVIDGNRPNILNVQLSLARRLDFKPGDDSVQASLDEDFVNRIMAPRSAAMDGCVRKIAENGRTLEGVVRIHVGPNGQPIGVELDGAVAANDKARECLVRQAAAALFHPFPDGDYATVRYKYQVTGSAQQTAEATP